MPLHSYSSFAGCRELSEPTGQLRPGHFNMKGACMLIHIDSRLAINTWRLCL